VGEAVVQFAGVFLGVIDHVFDRFERQGRVHHQHIGAGVHLREVNQVGHGVVFELGIQAMRHGVLPDASSGSRCNHRLARRHGAFRADNAAGAADVFDHHRLFEDPAQLIGHQSAHHIAGAPRRKRHDQFDRSVGVIALGLR
jgi:hypothetical protein